MSTPVPTMQDIKAVLCDQARALIGAGIPRQLALETVCHVHGIRRDGATNLAAWLDEEPGGGA
jgi:hypothetical protein